MLLVRNIDITAGTELLVHDELIGKARKLSKPRKNDPKFIVIDWSGCEEDAEHYLCRMKKKGGGGAHLYVEPDGSIWQFADLDRKVNRRVALDPYAIWVVLQNQGKPPASWIPRGTWRYRFGSLDCPVLGSTNDQLDALQAILSLICESILIEPKIPRTRKGNPILRPVPSARVRPETLYLASHLDPNTVAPGPGVIDVLDEIESQWNLDDEEEWEEEEIESSDEEFEFDPLEPLEENSPVVHSSSMK